MHWYLLLMIILNSNVLGFTLLAVISIWGMDRSELLAKAEAFDFLSPVWIYKHNGHKLLPAILLSVFFNLLCPIFSIIFWVSKIFNRKNS